MVEGQGFESCFQCIAQLNTALYKGF